MIFMARCRVGGDCRCFQVGGGFKEDDAVWKEPAQPKNEQLPELKVGCLLLVAISLLFFTTLHNSEKRADPI